MAEDMVAHVAQAIEEAALVWLTTPENFDKESVPPKVLARAAIEAMREPTPEMVKALEHYGMLDGDTDEAWQETINAALSPTPPD